MRDHPDIPSIEDLFTLKPARPPHPRIVKAEKELSEIGLVALEIANRECARLLANACLFRSPIADKEINWYGNEYKLPFAQAQAELRRLRDDS